MTSSATPPAAVPTEEPALLRRLRRTAELGYYTEEGGLFGVGEARKLIAYLATARTSARSATLEEPVPAHAIEAARVSLVADGVKNLSASDVERALAAAIRALKEH